MGAVAKSYMMKDFLIYEGKRKYLVKYEETVSHMRLCSAPFRISLYMRKILFSFVSVHFPYESRMSDFSTHPLDNKYQIFYLLF